MNFYKKLYEDGSNHPFIEGLDQSCQTSAERARLLERPFKQAQVKTEVGDLDIDKAPGFDGFTIAFVTVFFEIQLLWTWL